MEKIPQKFILKYFPKIVEKVAAARFFLILKICEISGKKIWKK